MSGYASIARRIGDARIDAARPSAASNSRAAAGSACAAAGRATSTGSRAARTSVPATAAPDPG